MPNQQRGTAKDIMSPREMQKNFGHRWNTPQEARAEALDVMSRVAGGRSSRSSPTQSLAHRQQLYKPIQRYINKEGGFEELQRGLGDYLQRLEGTMNVVPGIIGVAMNTAIPEQEDYDHPIFTPQAIYGPQPTFVHPAESRGAGNAHRYAPSSLRSPANPWGH